MQRPLAHAPRCPAAAQVRARRGAGSCEGLPAPCRCYSAYCWGRASFRAPSLRFQANVLRVRRWNCLGNPQTRSSRVDRRHLQTQTRCHGCCPPRKSRDEGAAATVVKGLVQGGSVDQHAEDAGAWSHNEGALPGHDHSTEHRQLDGTQPLSA